MFIKIKSIYGTCQIINLATVKVIEQQQDETAKIYWGDLSTLTTEPFEQVETAVRIAINNNSFVVVEEINTEPLSDSDISPAFTN